MRVSSILLPVDFSPQGMGSAKQAAALARQFKARVTLLHVIPPYEPIYYGGEFGGPVDTNWIRGLEDARRERLATWGADVFEGLTVQRLVETGDPAGQVVERSRLEQHDLIVMATHGYGRFRRFLLGSVTAKVLHDATCPVWTGVHLAEPAEAGWKPIHKVLCAVDLDAGSECVADWAWQFSHAFGARLTTLHVMPDATFQDPSWTIRLTEIAEQGLRGLMTSLGADQGAVRIGRGEPCRVIAEEAQRLDADVVVIGRSRPRREPGRLHAGAYSIIREAPCPVISV